MDGDRTQLINQLINSVSSLVAEVNMITEQFNYKPSVKHDQLD